MSKLLEMIKEDQLNARFAGDKFRADTLTTLLGEASPSGSQTVTDSDVEKVIGKFAKSVRDNVKLVGDDKERLAVYGAELAIYENYLPKQLNDEDLSSIIANYINRHGCETVGDVMQMLKIEYAGQYDGKTASKIVKEKLNG